MALIDIAKRVERLAIDNSPSLLTGLAVVGTVATAYLTGNAVIQAVLILEEKHDAPFEDVPIRREDIRDYWTVFIPPVLTGAFTVGCIIGAHTIGSRRAAAVAAAYSLSEKAYAEYRDKVVEKIGEKKDQKIRDEIQQDRIDRDPIINKEIVITGNGDALCYESLTGRYFMSNVETIRRAENDINRQILSQDYASLTSFFDLLGLQATEYSEEVGWNTENMLEVNISTTMSEDGRPCISVSYQYSPIRKYFRVF